MKLFLYSDGYFEDTLLYCFDSLFDLHINELILLKENHTNVENNKSVYDIFLAASYSEAIERADEVLIIKTSKNLYLYKKIKKYAKKQNKRVFIKSKKTTSLVLKRENLLKNLPVILILYFGRAPQQERVELLLNNYFKNQAIDVYQVFSNELLHLIQNDPECLIDCYVKNSLYIKDKSLGIICADGNLIIDPQKRNTSMFKYLLEINPDTVLICTESNDYYVRINEIEKYIQVILQKKEWNIIRSNYFSFYQTVNSELHFFTIYSKVDKKCNSKNEIGCEELTAKHIENWLYQISLPDGVEYIN